MFQSSSALELEPDERVEPDELDELDEPDEFDERDELDEFDEPDEPDERAELDDELPPAEVPDLEEDEPSFKISFSCLSFWFSVSSWFI